MDSPSPARRRFTLVDGMILVAAVAFGFGLLHSWYPYCSMFWALFFERLPSLKAWSKDLIQYFLTLFLSSAMPFAVSATVATMGSRLRGPRPRSRRLARQPGWMACLAASLGLLSAWAFTWARYSTSSSFIRCCHLSPPDDGMEYNTFSHVAAQLAGFAVVVAWATLLAGRRWRAEPSWVDRLGRLVGLAWIAMGLMAAYLAFEYYI